MLDSTRLLEAEHEARECLNITGSWKRGTGDTCALIIQLIERVRELEKERMALGNELSVLNHQAREMGDGIGGYKDRESKLWALLERAAKYIKLCSDTHDTNNNEFDTTVKWLSDLAALRAELEKK